MLCAVDITGCLGLGCRVLLSAIAAHSGRRLLDPPWKSAARSAVLQWGLIIWQFG
ncbi:hypothetical protein Dimus_024896, partial [Dionaea muscipula]